MNRAEVARARTLKSVALRNAVVSGHSHQVAACLIQSDMDPEGPGSRGGSPLLHAAEAGNTIIVGMLITAGAKINRRSGLLRSTALHAACECRRVEAVNQLLAAGADPRKTNSDRQTPLHSACFGGSVNIVTTLLEMGATTANRNKFGATPLSLAVTQGHFNVVKVLLAAGADPDACGTNGDTPLHLASAQGLFKIVVEILRAGAYPSARHEQTDETPLFIAARSGHGDIVRSLLTAGATPTFLTNGWTPLDIATHKTHVSVMREFLQYPSVLKGSDMAYNALRLAAAGGSCESVAVLLDAGVSSKLDEPARSPRQGDSGETHEAYVSRLRLTTPIEEARRHGNDAVVRQLERASVEKEPETSAPREAGSDLVDPIPEPVVDAASTPREAGRHGGKTSTATGVLVSLLKGQAGCDNDISTTARERDPERKVRFDLPETPTAEIVEAFPFPPAVAEVYVEESEVVGAFLPPKDVGMPKKDRTETERGDLLPKEPMLRPKEKRLEENIIQWCERVRTVKEQKGRPSLLRDGSPVSGRKSRSILTPQHEQDANKSTTVGNFANDRNIPTAAVCRVHRKKPKVLTTNVQHKERAPAHATVVVESSPKGWSGPDICQDLTDVNTTAWRGVRKQSLLGCWQSMSGAPTGVQGCKDPWIGRSEISPCAITAADLFLVSP